MISAASVYTLHALFMQYSFQLQPSIILAAELLAYVAGSSSKLRDQRPSKLFPRLFRFSCQNKIESPLFRAEVVKRAAYLDCRDLARKIQTSGRALVRKFKSCCTFRQHTELEIYSMCSSALSTSVTWQRPVFLLVKMLDMDARISEPIDKRCEIKHGNQEHRLSVWKGSWGFVR